MHPIREQELLPEEYVTAIFSNLEIICTLNTTLRSDIYQRVHGDNWTIVQKIGDVFLKIVSERECEFSLAQKLTLIFISFQSQTDYLKVYITYVKDYNNGLKVLAEARKEFPDFHPFCKVRKWSKTMRFLLYRRC
jgi:hypothetical protein